MVVHLICSMLKNMIEEFHNILRTLFTRIFIKILIQYTNFRFGLPLTTRNTNISRIKIKL